LEFSIQYALTNEELHPKYAVCFEYMSTST